MLEIGNWMTERTATSAKKNQPQDVAADDVSYSAENVSTDGEKIQAQDTAAKEESISAEQNPQETPPPSDTDSAIEDSETQAEKFAQENQPAESAKPTTIYLMTELERRAFMVYAQQCNMKGTCAVLKSIAPPRQEINISDLREKEEPPSVPRVKASKPILPAEQRALECCSVMFGELPAGYRMKLEIHGMIEEIDDKQQAHYIPRWSEKYFTSKVELRNFLCNQFAADVDSASEIYGKMRRGFVKPVAKLIGKNKELFTGVAVRLSYKNSGVYSLAMFKNLLPIQPTLIWIHDTSAQFFWKFRTPVLVEWQDSGDFFSETAGVFADALKEFWFSDLKPTMDTDFKAIDVPTTEAKTYTFFKVDASKKYAAKDFQELARVGLQCAKQRQC